MTNKWKKAAFTLIEVLAAMSVLLLIMMGLMRIFPEASDAFEKGTETVNRNAAAQAALQIIKQDLEGLVADNRLGFFKIAGLDSVIATTNRTYENDRIYFVTTNGDQDDGRAYQYVYYRSSPTLITNIYGVFTNCRLMRARMDFDKANNDPMALGYEFWNNESDFTSVSLVDNVVRFDIWVTGYDRINGGWGNCYDGDTETFNLPGSGSFSTNDWFNWFDGQAEWEPLMVEVLLQVASDEAMRKFDLLKRNGQHSLANETLNRDSELLVTRVYPMALSSYYAHPETQ